MSVGIAAIQEGTSTHIAAGNGYAIGLYIQELEAQGLSFEDIQRTLELEGLSITPAPKKTTEPATCRQIEEAIIRLDFTEAVSALRAFKQNQKVTREGRCRQLQCLRMRIEYHYGPDSNVYAMLMNILRA